MHETDIFQLGNFLQNQYSYGTKLEDTTLSIGDIKTKDYNDLCYRDKLIKCFPSSSSSIEWFPGGILSDLSK